jgi:dihydroorotate dehydrogenase
MGWYSAVGRRAFFALPPEASHRVATTMLGWPLPWERIGGAERDPRLAVTLAGITLANPVGLAAGFDKRCAHLDALGRIGFGYVVGGTITLSPRRGNDRPRIARLPERRSLVNAMGLPNPGAVVAAHHLAREARTAPRFVSLADEPVKNVVASADLLVGHADAIELNASCPNVSWGRDRDNEAHLAEMLVGLRALTDKPVFVKLPPFETEVEREVVLALARIARDGGAAGLTCSNTRPTEDPRLKVGAGGLSGAVLSEGTPRMVREVRAATGGALAINASGGIASAADALACIEAGATTVQVYTGMIYEGPGIVGEITRDLARILRERGLDLPALVGAA